MSYIYHMKPTPLIGDKLIPLNQMDKEGQLYKKHSSKYMGREELMNVIIPQLKCKWNDVVQFSALDPQLIVDELRNYQPDLKIIRTEYFKIHVKQILTHYDAVCFDRDISRKKGSFSIMEKEVKKLSNEYQELSRVPLETINYWEKVKNEGGKFLWFPFITHVLVKGTVDVSNFSICNLK
jgi:hypothetical protein